MTSTELLAILPLLILGAAAVLVMLLIAVKRHHGLTAGLAAAGLAAAFTSVFFAPTARATRLLVMDAFSGFFLAIGFAAAFMIVVFSYGYFREAKQTGAVPTPDETAPSKTGVEEYYLLLLLSTLGAGVVSCSRHFASFFLGLELLSVSLYALIAYVRGLRQGIEAGLKYLILAGVSSGFLLFGMALIYASLGTMDFAEIARLSGAFEGTTLYLIVGTTLLATGIGFKLALVPFHMWTPDVYQGAPAPVTAFIATVSKGAMLALVLRYFVTSAIDQDPALYRPVFAAIATIAVASMFVGNLLALLQNNLKKILAYSSISHLGYILIAILAGGSLGASAVAFYVVAYFVTILCAFGVITVLSRPGREAEELESYRGLFWERPLLSAILAGALLSLAGIPLTIGFIGKYYVVAAGVGSSLWLLVAVLALNSAIGIYYYLRVIVTMLRSAEEPAQGEGVARPIPHPALVAREHFAAPAADLRAREAEPAPALETVAIPFTSVATLGVLALLLIALGAYPTPLVNIIQTAIAALLR